MRYFLLFVISINLSNSLKAAHLGEENGKTYSEKNQPLDEQAVDKRSTFPLTTIASERWSAGQMPCDLNAAKSKIRIAMDVHNYVPQCKKDEEEELDKAKAGEAYVIREGFPRSYMKESMHIVGSENETLHMFAPMFISFEYVRKYPSDESDVPLQYRNYVRTLTARSLAQIAQWSEWKHPEIAAQMPDYLKKLAESEKVRNAVTQLAEKESDENWKALMAEMAAFENEYFKGQSGWADKKKAYEQILAASLRPYTDMLSRVSSEKNGDFNVAEKDIKAIRDFADGKLPPNMRSTDLRETLFAKFLLLRNDSLIRSVADLFCQAKESGKTIYGRFGLSHVPEVYSALERRIVASGGNPSDFLELDSRVLDHKYEGAEEQIVKGLTREEIATIYAFVQKVKKD